MKRQSVFIFALLIALLFTGVTTNASSNYLDISMNGKQISVREVPIIKDGEVIKSDSPSFVYVDRTLVSARLVSESYGAKVDWDSKDKIVTITQEDIEVKLQIDEDIAIVNGKKIKLDENSIPRLVNFGGDSAFTMVPINFLAESLGYNTRWDQKTRTVYLLEKDSTSEIKNDSSQNSKPEIIEDEEENDNKEEVENQNEENQNELDNKEEVVLKNQVSGIDLLEENMLKINGTKKVERNIFTLNNPDRIVIDLMDSELVGNDYLEYHYNLGIIEKVRISQFTPDKNYSNIDKIVRVVLDIKPGVDNPKVDLKEEGENILVIPEKSFWDNISYKNNTIEIKNRVATTYEIKYLKDSNMMEIYIPGKNIDLVEGKRALTDPLVRHIEIVKDKDNYKVLIKLRRAIKYDIRSGEVAKNIVVGLERDGDIKSSDRIIVIDPGHGGRDPGAVRAGVREKDLTLSMSLKLEEKLSALGYDVYMTRDTDQTLLLKDRPKVANDLEADLFISMHINSSSSTAASGIEVFYTPKSNNPLKGSQQTQFARIVQEELIKATGAKNRGAKTANFLVIRNTEMPSILVEAGFISNTVERNKMLDDSYQDKIADAIVKGIERYFAIY